MSDLIDRQAAIDAMATTIWHYPNECYRNLNEYEFAKGLAELGLKSVPSAQPEERTEERTETHACDCISRQDAIRIVDGIDTWQAGWRGNAIESMKALPSV